MGEKLAFRLAVVAAVVMLAVMPLMAITAAPCDPLPMPTILAFELVRSLNDLAHIFGAPGDECRAALTPQVDHANVVDIIAYIPAYTAFFALVAYGLGRRDRATGWLTIWLALACAAADVVENLALFALSADPDTLSPWLATLIVATNIKWVGLAGVTTLCGLMLVRRGGFGWVALIICAAPLLPAVWALVAPEAGGPYLMHGMVVASVMLLGVAVVESVRPAKRTVVAAA